MVKVGIFGATGYTALELIKLLINHPKMGLVYLGSQSSAGKKLKEIFPFLGSFPVGNLTLEDYESYPKLDIAFLALPHEVSMEIAPKLLKEGIKVIDLSGAYRFNNPLEFEKFYGFQHKYPELLEKAVYGLPEIYRQNIREADFVANPGCYPTATLLGLYPLLKNPNLWEDDTVIVNGLSGVSGAGRGLKQHFHFPEMVNNMFAYKVVGHRHTPEMEYISSKILKRKVKIRFVPTVVPIDRGMLSVVHVKIKKTDLRELYRETYSNERFVRIVDQPPKSKEVANSNYCFIYPTYDERSGYAVIVSAIDNLLKGASGQALQNANLMVGLEEYLGLNCRIPSIL